MAYRLRGRFGYPKDYPFKPTFHPDKLQEPYRLRKPKKIFTVSMGDFFDREVKPQWRDKIIEVIMDNPQHTFQILTKQPQNIKYTTLPKNVWMGVSVTCPDDLWRIDKLLDELAGCGNILFVSLEPYLKDVVCYEDFYHDYCDIDWWIIGGLTGPKRFDPPKTWVDSIVNNVNGAVFVKDNVSHHQKIKYFPQGDLDE
jgi:protein gp37